MAFREVRSWTFFGLIGAFLNLGLVYFLLCVSAFVFFTSKLLNCLGLLLPCPCNGVFGYRNGHYCWHEFLFRIPIEKIHEVQMSAKSRFPFNLICFKDPNHLNRKLIEDNNFEKEAIGLEDGPCSSSYSSPRIQNIVGRENGNDVKGKRIMNLKYRSGIRPRRTATLQNGKFSSACYSDILQPVVCIFPSQCDGRETIDQTSQSSGTLAGREDNFQDYENAFTGGQYMGERTNRSSEFGESFIETEVVDKHSFSFGITAYDAQEKTSITASESDTIKMLEQALQREKAACAVLHLELEKERAAAATAADEAMAMISRLQDDKASIETEARQYQRMIEEKFDYDEEEVDILKEILVRKERENHLLEKEIETYRQMSYRSNGTSKSEYIDIMDEWVQCSSSSLESNCEKMGSTVESPSSCETPFVEEQSYSSEHGLIDQKVVFLGKEKGNLSSVRAIESNFA